MVEWDAPTGDHDRDVLLVVQSAALVEALNNFLLHCAQHGNILGKDRHVIRRCCPRQEGGMFRWQVVARAGGVHLDYPSRDHGTQPLAHITLIQPGFVGNFG